MKKLQRRGSLRGLEDRGYLNEDRGRKDVFMNDVMKNVNTVPMPSLSEEQISAARSRRQKERANHRISLDDIELPTNHPWATRAPGAQDDEERVRAQLRVRRGAPLAPNSLSRGDSLGGVSRFRISKAGEELIPIREPPSRQAPRSSNPR
ncbi:hypothetical protein QJQ45_016878 [Haematococcus lacustris]|nr:hypothetical protein QJQ45_016878 [Haematococcus lacustris]